MINVGVVGIGFMGNMHFSVHQENKRSRVVAIADIDRQKLKGDWSGIAGNIGGPGGKVDLTGIKTYTDALQLINDPDVDLVDITLPSYLHARYTIAALRKGKHVMCEKPIALTLADAKRMVMAADKAKGKLMIGHCIRFWPEYEVAKRIVDAGKYGRVYSATFTRISPTPTWSWQNWLQNSKRSGAALIDLHIHDLDYINWMFGMPKAISSLGVTKTSGGLDHLVTNFYYPEKNLQVSAEGGWIAHPAFPFSMSFTIFMEKASLNYHSGAKPTMRLYMADGSAKTPRIPKGDGYHREIDYFLRCINKDKDPETVTPEAALEAVRLALAERQSVRFRSVVKVR